MKEEVIKKSISLREDIYDYALGESEKMHGGNFSAFITYLISCHKHSENTFKTYGTADELVALEFPNDKKVRILKVRHDTLLANEEHLTMIEKICDTQMDIEGENHLSIKEDALKKLVKYLFNDETINDNYKLSIVI